jgi:hypothetical protein
MASSTNAAPKLNSGFERLRWNVLGSLESIQVMDDPDDLHSSCSPLAGHQISLESVMNPSKSHMRVFYKSFTEHDYWSQLGLEPPPPLNIAKPDRDVISVYDFIVAVDQYFKGFREDVIKVVGLNETEKLWFDRIQYEKGSAAVEETFYLSFFKEDVDSTSDRWAQKVELVRSERLWAQGVHLPGQGNALQKLDMHN